MKILLVMFAFVAAQVLTSSQAHASFGDSFGVEKASYDIGISSGTYQDVLYTEAELGLNLFFSDYFAWRNALFGRFPQGEDNIYGLDTSFRGILDIGKRDFGLGGFAGPGYRFASRGDSMPFVEGGLFVKVSGLAVGVGVKALLDSWIHSGVPNDTEVFFILAGGGSL